MLTRSTISTLNGVYTASVAVELDALDSVMTSAYGEPRIDTAGLIPFSSTLANPATSVALDYTADLGSVPAAGSALLTPTVGARAYTIQGSGTLSTDTAIVSNPGRFIGTQEIVGDFDIRAQLLSFTPVISVPAADGFAAGFLLSEGTGDSNAGTLFAWGAHRGTPAITHRRRATDGAALATVASVAMASPIGLYIRVVRSGNDLTGYYSVDAGTTWTALGTSVTTRAALRVGLFVNSGSNTVATLLATDVLLQTVPTEETSFTITGGPNLRYIRSQSPHTINLDGKVDPDALAKVKGWVDTLRSRLSTIKTTLYTNPNPKAAGADGAETVETVA